MFEDWATSRTLVVASLVTKAESYVVYTLSPVHGPITGTMIHCPGCQADFSDIRLTQNDLEVPYGITVLGGTGVLWVKLALVIGKNRFKIHWGRSGVTTTGETYEGELDDTPEILGCIAPAGSVIQIKRGSDWTGHTLDAGELGLNLSTKDIRIGTADGQAFGDALALGASKDRDYGDLDV